jgi:hypothetical protein
MSEPRSQTTTSLFRTSLRTWQARYKAQQAQAAPAEPAAPPAPAPTRVKRMAPYRRRRAAAAASRS